MTIHIPVSRCKPRFKKQNYLNSRGTLKAIVNYRNNLKTTIAGSHMDKNSQKTHPLFNLCTNEMFDLMLELDIMQKNSQSEMRAFTESYAVQLKDKFQLFPLLRLMRPADETIEISQRVIDQLRILYPYLAELPDRELYYWFDDYQAKCRYKGSLNSDRDTGFLHFLLGKIASLQALDGEQSEEAGLLIAFAVLNDIDTDTAMAIGLDSYHFYSSVRTLTTITTLNYMNVVAALSSS